MSKNRFIVFDTETGGLKKEENPIMEIALVALDGETLEEIGRWESLVKNYGNLKYEPKALETHGISISDVNNRGADISEVTQTLIKFFREFTPKGDRGGGRPILSGHNVGFDVGFLKTAFSMTGQDLCQYVLEANGEITTFDTLPASKFVWPIETKHTLGECCKRAGMGDFTAHRAMPDVIASCDLIRFFRSVFQGKDLGKSTEIASKGNRTLIKAKHKIRFQF